MDSSDANSKMDSQSAPACGAALLLVIGEPHSDEHKSLILAEVTKGFRCWDSEVFDINDELAQIANKADLGEEGPNGERIIRHRSGNLCCEILVNPQSQTVSLAVKNFLSTPTKYKHLIYAGHAFQGSGAWILQDDTYTFSNFAHNFKDQDVDNAVKQQEGCSLNIYTPSEGNWTNGHITKNDFSKLLTVKLNPDEKLESIHGVLQFTAYVGNFVKVRQLNELLQSTDVVGNIRFSRPTLYIFPGCQGDSALFGISGFNLLVNGGFSRRACFWDFTRHLDRIDAALMTHLGTDNLYGLSAVLQRKATENVHPEIGFMYLNVSDKLKAVQDSGNETKEESSLMVNLANEGNKIVEYAKQLGQFPHPCSRSQGSQIVEPINLFHKVGIGSLDMYILNPITDSKELKEFYQQWNQRVAQFGLQQHVPLPNTLSVCALLVWRPSNPNDNITRIFFPGNAPQHRVMEGLEKLKNIDILKHAQCTKTSLSVKPAAKKPSTGTKPPVPRSKVSPVQTPKQEVPKKEIHKTETKAPPKPRPASAPKTKKDISNKKTSKENEKTDKTKSSTSSSPSKASTKSATPSTPKEIVSPTQEPAEPAPVKEPQPAPEVVPPPLVDVAPKPEPEVGGSADLLGLDSSVDPPRLVDAVEPAPLKHEDLEPAFSESPAPLPEPEHEHEPEQTVSSAPLGKDQLLELGVYDEDQDLEEHLNAQPKPTDKVSQMFGGMTDSMHEDLQPAMSDLMTTSMHESMYDDREQFGEQPQAHNGLVLTPDDEDSEEIQPQALPEPMAYAPASYSQEPDLIPIIPAKEASAVPEPELTPSFSEPDVLPVKQEQEDLDDQSTAKIEDELSAANDIDDKHFDQKETESPDEISSKLPLDEHITGTSIEPEKHLSEDEGFDQEHFKEDEVEEKDVTEDSEKVLPADIIADHQAQSLECQPEKMMLESGLNTVHDNEQKVASLSEPELESVEKENVYTEEEDFRQEKSDTVETTSNSEAVEGTDVDNLHTFDEGIDTKREENSDEMEEDSLPLVDVDTKELETHTQEKTELAAFESETKEITDVDSLPVADESKHMQINEELDDLGMSLQKHSPDLESPSVSPVDEIEKEVTKHVEQEPQEQIEKIEEKILESEQMQPERQEPTELTQLQTEAPFNQQPEPKEPTELTQLQTEAQFNQQSEWQEPTELTQLQTEAPFDQQPEPQEPTELTQLQTEAPFNQQRTAEEDHEFLGEDRESPDMLLESEQNIKEEFDSEEHELIESQEMRAEVEPDIVERPRTPEPEEIEAVEIADRKGQDVSHEGTPDSIEEESKDEEMIENDFVGDEGIVNNVHKKVEDDVIDADEEKENVPLMESLPSQQPLEEANRDSLERDSIPVPADFQDDQRDSVEREEDEEEEDDEEEESSEEEEESQSQSTSYEEEEASDQKCLIQDSVSEDQKVNIMDPTGAGVDSGAAGHVDSLGMDSQPSDSLLTPESEMTDHSPGFAMDYHQMGEQDDADSFEGVDHLSSVPASHQAYPVSQDFGQPSVEPSGVSSNPFDMDYHPGSNQFIGIESQPVQAQHENPFEDSSDDEQAPGGPTSFDPLAEWGQPMGLPSPSPADTKSSGATSDKKSPKDKPAKPTELKKTDTKKAPASASKTKTAIPATKTPKQSNGIPEKSKSRLSGVGTSNPSRLSTGGTANSLNTSRLSSDKKPATSKTRPASAPVKDKAPHSETKRPATATGKSSAASTTKMPPLPPFTPFYVDLTYIPNHGNPQYSDVEFFKRVRARYYVLSSLSPNPAILDSLLEAKKTWEDKESAVTIIPTYDNETLRHWMGLHKETLSDMKIEVAPSASRCTIQLQDHETSSSAYRLEF